MALNAAYIPRVVVPRFGEGGDDGGDDGGGGGEGIARPFLLFPAVFNDGGAVVPVSYLSDILSPDLLAQFAAVGYAVETGFLANVDGEAVATAFVAAVSPTGSPPFGTAELFDDLTKDGVTNLSRWLVRLGP
jgi:hypothetical protein